MTGSTQDPSNSLLLFGRFFPFEIIAESMLPLVVFALPLVVCLLAPPSIFSEKDSFFCLYYNTPPFSLGGGAAAPMGFFGGALSTASFFFAATAPAAFPETIRSVFC